MKTILIILLLLPVQALADSFKWRDDKGTLNFTDNITQVPASKQDHSQFNFAKLPPVPIIKSIPIKKKLPIFSAISAQNNTNSPERITLKNIIRFFEKDKGRYDVMIHKWPPSIAKWRMMRKAVLKTTGAKKNILYLVSKDLDSTALTIVKAYLKESIKNDGIMAKWRNFGNLIVKVDKMVKDKKTGKLVPVIDPKTKKNVQIKKRRPTGNIMTRKLVRRLQIEEGQKELILIALKMELKTL